MPSASIRSSSIIIRRPNFCRRRSPSSIRTGRTICPASAISARRASSIWCSSASPGPCAGVASGARRGRRPIFSPGSISSRSRRSPMSCRSPASTVPSWPRASPSCARAGAPALPRSSMRPAPTGRRAPIISASSPDRASMPAGASAMPRSARNCCSSRIRPRPAGSPPSSTGSTASVRRSKSRPSRRPKPRPWRASVSPRRAPSS